jgi:hypothetical protein
MIFLHSAVEPGKDSGGRGRWRGNPGIQFHLAQFSPRFLDRFSVHHQESSTVHAALHTGFADCLLVGSRWNILILLASSQ